MVFNEIDWCIIGLILISTVISLWRGFVKEILSLIIWIVAVVIAWLYGGAFSSYLSPNIEQAWLRIAISCAILFILTLIVGAIVNFVLTRLIKATGLSATDRFLGMFFGAARGAIAVVIVVGLLVNTPVSNESETWKESSLIPSFLVAANWSKNVVLGGWRSIPKPEDIPLNPKIDLPVSSSQ
ncbi:CvpA family protein [Entomomonas moraniae]|uniref:CvpA family protein n=1 Tax=Entomomonas moraniae TaxID=2213226 RepID=A0A3Q9JLP9_9GAMM|nr:CvpA family protein [Entomomonas moraniae]AZS50584.1 CvpA family protein [Entomomonas moraniae]